MSIYAVKARGENGFRRAGIAFAFAAWTLVANPPPEILKETHLDIVDLSEPNVQRKIGVLPITNLNEFPDSPEIENLEGPAPNYKVLFDEQASKNDVLSAKLDSLDTENDSLADRNQELTDQNQVLINENRKLRDTIAILQSIVDAAPNPTDIDSAKIEIEELKAQLAAAPKAGNGKRTTPDPAAASSATPPVTSDQLNQAAVATADGFVQTQTAPIGQPPADTVQA